MDFQKYMQARNPESVMAGAMAGPTGASYGEMAMRTLQQSLQQARAAQAPPGGPSLPQSPRGLPPTAPMNPGGGMPGQPMMGQPPSADPEFMRGWEIGQLLKQSMRGR